MNVRALFGVLIVLVACSPSSAGPSDAGDDDQPPPGVWQTPLDPNPRGPFPAGFLFGSSTSAYQIEGGLTAITDEGAWETTAGHIANGDHADDGPQSRKNYAADVAALVATHQNAYRFGIEWARLFPSASAWSACRAAGTLGGCEAAADPTELAYYKDLLAKLKAANITPMVTLWHSTFPLYINDPTKDWHTTGWLSPTIGDDLAAWASFAAGEFGSSVTWWLTLNEPFIAIQGDYIDGSGPPGQVDQLDALKQALLAMIKAHVAMYDAIHAVQPTAMVSITQDVHLYYGETPGRPEDDQSAKEFSYLSNALFLNAIVNGDVDLDINGTIDAGEPSADPAYKGRADYIGVNYYGFSIVRGYPGFPLVDGVTLSDSADHGLPKNDLGWDIYPRGLGEALDFAAGYKLPIVITENGLADAGDVNRPRFIAEHLAELAAKIAAGVDVRGYFHWSLLDNFEWSSGFCPRFGLFHVDYTDPARTRTARPSASVYQQIIDQNQVTDALLSAQPAYAAPTVTCQ
ncbi:MAG TPA: family 1 glycosylhydrolase [Polyangiaceae bacterium]|jgi:beta-glucosidase